MIQKNLKWLFHLFVNNTQNFITWEVFKKIISFSTWFNYPKPSTVIILSKESGKCLSIFIVFERNLKFVEILFFWTNLMMIQMRCFCLIKMNFDWKGMVLRRYYSIFSFLKLFKPFNLDFIFFSNIIQLQTLIQMRIIRF